MRRHWLPVAGILFFIIAWSLLLYHVPPTEIVNAIGTQNSLAVAFLVSTFGGVSTVTSANFYAVVLTLAAGGASPIGLGIAAGTGITIGDSLFYYFGTEVHDLLSSQPLAWANRLENWIRGKHETLVQVIVYIYTGFTPLPNDVLTVGLGLAEYSYRRLLPALLLGNITLTILIAEFAARSQIIQQLFGV